MRKCLFAVLKLFAKFRNLQKWIWRKIRKQHKISRTYFCNKKIPQKPLILYLQQLTAHKSFLVRIFLSKFSQFLEKFSHFFAKLLEKTDYFHIDHNDQTKWEKMQNCAKKIFAKRFSPFAGNPTFKGWSTVFQI